MRRFFSKFSVFFLFEIQILKKSEKMVDSRVRVQLSPSPVKHQKNIIKLNQWSRLFKSKIENIYFFPHTTLSLFLFPFVSLSIHHKYVQDAADNKMDPVMKIGYTIVQLNDNYGFFFV